MRKKYRSFKKLMAILLSLQLTVGAGSFTAFAAELDGVAEDAGYSESTEPSGETEATGGEAAESGESTEPSEPEAPSEPEQPSEPEPSEPEAPAEPSEPAAPAGEENGETPGEETGENGGEVEIPDAETPAAEAPAEEALAESAPQAAPAVQAVTQFEVDGITYSVTGSTVIAKGYSGESGKVVIPATVTYDDETYDVVGIVSGFGPKFQGNPSIEELVIEAPITELGSMQFANCANLTRVTLPDTIKSLGAAAFQNSSSLTEIDLPEGLEIIKNAVFKGTALKDVKLPSTLTEVQAGAFEGLTSLESVDFNGASAAIGNTCFKNCANLSEVTGAENVVSIGKEAFQLCYALEKLSDLNSVKTIGDSAFQGCKMETVSGLDNVTSLGYGVFTGCSALKRISGLKNVTSLGSMVFMNCSALEEIDLDWSALTAIGDKAFQGDTALALEWGEDTFKSIKTLGQSSFSKVNVTGKLILPEGVATIPANAFKDLGISEAILPNSVEKIDGNAFNGCANLTYVHIGKDGESRLTSIGMLVFVKTGMAGEDVLVIETSEDAVKYTKNMSIQKNIVPKFTVRSVSGEDIYADDPAKTTLQQAIDAAADGDTITVTKDFLIKTTVTIPDGKTITLTDDGKGLIAQADKSLSGAMFDIADGAKLILAGTISYKCQNLASGVVAKVSSALSMDGGTISRAALSGRESGVIDVDGGVFTMNGGTITRVSGTNYKNGAVYVHNNGKFNLAGGEISESSFTNQESGAVVLDGGEMTMMSGSIHNNDAANGIASAGVMVCENSLFTMSGGTIADNTAKRGGAVHVGVFDTVYNADTSAKFVMSGGVISGNVASPITSDVNAGGGGVLVEDNGEFEMTGGTISGNKTLGSGMGGGVATANAKQDGGGRFTMNGGTISGNFASNGGGVYSCSLTDAVVLNAGAIVGNSAGASDGGVYVATHGYGLTVNNALVTGNTAAVMGGGVWSCPTGTFTLGAHSAVFGNKADKAGDDVAFLDKQPGGYYSTVSGEMLGGGRVTWYKDNWVDSMGGQMVLGTNGSTRFDAADPGGPVAPVSGSEGAFSLKAVVSADGRKQAEGAASLIIEGNTAQRGGGIGTNGEILMPGEQETTDTSITVKKVWQGNDGNYPTAVTVNLIRISEDGTRTAIASVILSEKCTDKDGNVWAYTFTDLDDAYTYTVTEDAVNGYKTSITGSAADGFTVTNTKTTDTPDNPGGGGGGGSDPDPDPSDPPVDIPDDPTPLAPEPPVEEIPDEEVPLAPLPEEPEKREETEDIPDEDVPKSDVPKTGDSVGLWALLCAMSMMGLSAIFHRKHED